MVPVTNVTVNLKQNRLPCLGFIIRAPFNRDGCFYLLRAVAEAAGGEGVFVAAGFVQEAAPPATAGAGDIADVFRFGFRAVPVRHDVQDVFQFAHNLLDFRIIRVLLIL